MRRLVVTSLLLAACAPRPDRRGPGASDSAAVVSAKAPTTDAARMADAAPKAPQVETDTVRGVIESVGNEPQTRVLVRQHDHTTCAVSATAAVVPASVSGLEVTLWGVRAPVGPPMMPGVTCAITARRFAVRAADGVPAVDGVLRADGTSFALQLANGERRALRNVPAVLRARVGARIFWAGPLDRAPVAYGVLRDAP